MAGRSKSSKRARLYEKDGEDDHSMEEDDDVGNDEGDNVEDDVVEKAKKLMI
ncbi:hypothetical protein DY000_02060312 [Brassica cretica]|uniref:Uncharacterized protein n=1 Tax=Brassica cretica TaxID=69181 RepID=A0ABQ7B3W7_BRACR|nr:hypothetical protein DY000_02060312 [Brassica cretica]